MPQINKRVVAALLFMTLTAVATLAQSTSTITEGKDKNLTDVIAELRLTRQVIQQLQSELKQLQVVAIRIRLQQDVVTNKEVRLDSLKSEVQVTEDGLTQIRDRVRKLESNDLSASDETEQQRVRAEVDDAKKEIEREQLKLDTLRSQVFQLTTELQAEKTHLAEMIAALEAIGADRISERSENQLKPCGPNGPPKR